MDIDLERVREAFLAESEEDLVSVEQAVLRLEKNPGDREPLALVFRKFHTLKGNALALGLERLGGFAHRVEDLLGSLREGTEPITQDLISFLLEAVDQTRALVTAVTSGHDVSTARAEELLDRIRDGHLGPARVSQGQDAESGRDLPEAGLGDGVSRTLRIDASKLDELLNVTSEIAIARGRLGSLIAEHGSADIEAAYLSMERLLANLHQSVTNVRMVPLAPLLERFQRVVRDLALSQGKQVELVVSDQGVEVDTSVVEQLRAPLDQMIRNAVYHGIEAPRQREAAGKGPVGRIELRARHHAGGIVIEVQDDGRGLDRERILERARSLGAVHDTVPLSDQDVAHLIFRQGLSTAEKVTSTSGRGVGMDVVLRNLSALGGSVDVASRPGEGMRLTIRMPLTLAIIEGLVVGVADETFVLPLASVSKCVDLARALERSASEGVLNVEGRATSVMRLRSTFGLDDGAPSPAEVAVIVQKGEDQIGLVVDRLIGRAQVVVKPPCRFLEGASALSGMTILGNGVVASILNVAGLVRGTRGHDGTGEVCHA